MTKLILLLITTAGLLAACKKGSSLPQPITPEPPVLNISPSVYVAGDSFDLTTQLAPYPVYWKNNQQILLANQAYTSATGIAVSDSNVYVSSSGSRVGENVTYWQNGVGFDLSDPTITYSTAKALTLSGNDVYVTGIAYINNFERLVPIYWKNKEPAKKITAGLIGSGSGTSIAVSGQDVYITGRSYNPAASSFGGSPCYWKNGVVTYLFSDINQPLAGIANAICVSGSDVHVAGIVYTPGSLSEGTVTYWKNGVATNLSPNQIAAVKHITVAGNDVYIAGTIDGPDHLPQATYWKNGVAVILETTLSAANSIAVFENDIYVAGNRKRDTALYWKNGKPVILGRGRANSIAVKK